MYKIYIETSGAGIVYESDINLIDFFKKDGKFLEFPGLKVYEQIPTNYSYVVKYFNSDNPKIICTEKSIEIYYPISNLKPASIAFMGYILMEKQRAEKSMVTIHSGCIEKDNNGVLLLGRSGSGKTTLALNLCLEDSFSLVGNDRNVIGLDEKNNVIAYDGTKFIFLRYESIKRNLPELLRFFPEKEIDPWLRKTKILPSNVGIRESNSPTKINKSYIIHIDNNQQDLYTHNGDNPSNRLYLNELFSMYIRGVYTTFCDKNFHAVGYIPSYDKENYYKKRNTLINSIFTETQLEYISGNISCVSKYINEKHKELVYNSK